MGRHAGIVNAITVFGQQIIIPFFHHQRQSILSQTGRPGPFQAVKGNLLHTCIVEDTRNITSNLFSQFRIRQKYLVTMIHQLADRISFGMGYSFRTPRPTLAIK